MKKNLYIVLFVNFVNSLSITIIIPVLYLYGKQYNLSDFLISLLLTSFALAQFIANPLLGRLSDFYGRRPILSICLLGTAASNFMVFFAPNAAFLFFARILDGITGGNNSVAAAVVSDITEPKDRAKAFGMFGAAFGVAFVIGPLLGAYFERFSLGTPFLVGALFALLGSFLSYFVLQETVDKTSRPKKINLKNLGFKKVFLATKNPILGPLLKINFLLGLVFGIFMFAIQPYALNTLGLDAKHLGILFVIFGVLAIFTQLVLVPPITKKFGYINPLIYSTLIGSVMFFMYLVPSNLLQFLIVYPFFAIAGSLYRPIISSLVSFKVLKEDQGAGMGLVDSYLSLAIAIGPAIGGLIADYSYTLPFVVAGALGLINVFYMFKKKSVIRAKSQASIDI